MLPRRSPLMEFASNPSVLGVLGMDAGPSDLSELLKEDVENTEGYSGVGVGVEG